LAGVDPRAHDVRPDVRLVQMVGTDDLNLHALDGGAEILDRHARGDHGPLAAQVGIGARHVIHDADLDGAVGVLCLRPEAPEGDRERRETDQPSHWVSPLRTFRILASFTQGTHEVFGSLNTRTESFDRALALGRRSAIRLKLPQYDHSCAFMRLSRITRTAISAGEMKPQLERQPEILR